MTGSSPKAWGHSQRYFAEHNNSLWEPDEDQVQRALETAVPRARETVERTCKQWNASVRECLRNEMALRLSAGGDVQTVPIQVVRGMPRPFAKAIDQFRGLEWLLLHASTLKELQSGARFLEQHVDEVRRSWGARSGPAGPEDARRVHDTAVAWLHELEALQAVERIVAIEEDVLGAYFLRIPQIRLYWVVIGVIAQTLGISIQGLTVVTLAHELAHAYTHVGRDIDSESWETGAFAGTDAEIVEGLAQYYTEAVCRRLESRMPAALEAFEKLLERQIGPYVAHRLWGLPDGRAGEIVRASMIECRINRVRASADFEQILERHRVLQAAAKRKAGA